VRRATAPARDRAPAQQQLVNAHFEREVAEWADIYRRRDVTAFRYQERLRIVLEMAGGIGPPGGRARALDLGCGAGLAALALAEKGYVVDAVDAVPGMVQALGERVRQGGLDSRVRCSLGDARALSFADESFGLVVAMGLLDWLAPIETPLREIWRVLEPGGFLIVTIGNRWSLRNFVEPLANPLLEPAKRLARRLLRRPPKARPRFVSVRHCDALLRASGFDKVRSLTLGFGPFSVFGRELLPNAAALRLHRWLQAAAERGFPVLRRGGSVYIALVRKRSA
jgi:SAM-dependent methyltransferase